LVLIGAFTSVADVGAEYFPWLPVRHFNTIKYATAAKLPQVHVPVLIMHSRTDEIIRFRHSEKNFTAANEPKTFVELHGSHNETLAVDSDRAVAALDRLLDSVKHPQPAPH